MTTLRPYQVDVLARSRAALAAGSRNVLAVMPTGAGKTVTFAELAAQWPGRVGIVAHRRELIRQASEKLGDLNHGIIAPGFPGRAGARIQVGSVQTLGRRLDNLPRFDLLIFDEAHHSVTGMFRNLRQSQPQAALFGVTATPERMDGRGLGEAFDSLIVGPSIAELVALGHLSESVVYAPPAPPDMCGVRTLAGDYSPEELAAIMDQPCVIGDAAEHYFWHSPGQPAIVFCAGVAHAEHTAAAFRAEGWRAVAVHGGMSAAERDAAIGGLATGAVELLMSADLISEGVDIPSVSVVIQLRPTQSRGLNMQQVGRGMRPAPGKRRLIVLDHAGNTLRHGMPDADRVWTLDSTKRRDKTAPAVRQCSGCFAMFAPAPACPQCGQADAAAKRGERGATGVQDGTLAELTAEDPRLVMLRTKPLRELVKQARGYSALLEIEQARGFKDGWAQNMLERKAALHRQYRRAA